jgi:hypothetical protein
VKTVGSYAAVPEKANPPSRRFSQRRLPLNSRVYLGIEFKVTQNPRGFVAFINFPEGVWVQQNPIKGTPFSNRKNCIRAAKHVIKRRGKKIGWKLPVDILTKSNAR